MNTIKKYSVTYINGYEINVFLKFIFGAQRGYSPLSDALLRQVLLIVHQTLLEFLHEFAAELFLFASQKIKCNREPESRQIYRITIHIFT